MLARDINENVRPTTGAAVMSLSLPQPRPEKPARLEKGKRGGCSEEVAGVVLRGEVFVYLEFWHSSGLQAFKRALELHTLVGLPRHGKKQMPTHVLSHECQP